MSPFDPLGNARAATCERQRPDAVRPKNDPRINVAELLLWLECVFARNDVAVLQELQRRDLHANLKFRGNVVAYGGCDVPRALQHDQPTRLCNAQIYCLP